jgi:hypothetical protein
MRVKQGAGKYLQLEDLVRELRELELLQVKLVRGARLCVGVEVVNRLALSSRDDLHNAHARIHTNTSVAIHARIYIYIYIYI